MMTKEEKVILDDILLEVSKTKLMVSRLKKVVKELVLWIEIMSIAFLILIFIIIILK